MKIRDENGKRQNLKTDFYEGDGQETLAKRYAVQWEKLAAKRRTANVDGPLTVRKCGDRWLDGRFELQRAGHLGDVNNERTRMNLIYATRTGGGMLIGDMLMADLTSNTVVELITALKLAGRAPNYIWNIYGTFRIFLKAMALKRGVLADGERPWADLPRNTLPPKGDKDKDWRDLATYTTDEVRRLICDPRIQPDRRVMYAIKALSGARHADAAPRRWRDYERAGKPWQPLGRLRATTGFSSTLAREWETKTKRTYSFPVHATLAIILDSWWSSGWAQTYGRAPRPDDLIVPTRNGTPCNVRHAQEFFLQDLAKLGLRIRAGMYRNRGGHDFRSWWKTELIVESGAIEPVIERIIHPEPRDVASGYLRTQWAGYCREVAKLRFELSDADNPGLGTPVGTRFPNTLNRWQKQSQGPVLEADFQGTQDRPNSPVAVEDDANVIPLDRARLTDHVPIVGTSPLDELQAAIRSGDTARALELAAALQTPTDAPRRKSRR